MNIHEVVRATQVLEDILAEYEVDPAKRLYIISHYQIELIERELNEPDAVPSRPNGVGSAPGSVSGTGAGRGFQLRALTDKGRAGLAEVERVLAPLLGESR